MKTIYQKLWDAIKAVLKGKFITLNSYISKEGSCINSSALTLKTEKKEQSKQKVSTRKKNNKDQCRNQ